MRKLNTYYLLVVIILMSQWTFVFGQKLPKVQKTSARAPENIKIDGKATEWNNKFQAYNKNTELYYTIANDDDNLYLLIRADKSDIITKMIHSGTTFAINAKEKKDGESFAVTYPKYQKKETPLYLTLSNRPKGMQDSIKTQLQIDSFINTKNKQLSQRLRYIGIKGITQTSDSIMRVKNTANILSSASLNNQFCYTYELSIPLKLLPLTAGIKKSFYYHITLNGVADRGGKVNIIETAKGERITYTGADGVNYVLPSVGINAMTLAFSTDFWGEYTLAKKQ